jgi:outer membrane lipoprotein-sorting protein
MKHLLILLIIAVITSPAFAQTPTGEEILRKIDENMVIDEAISRTTMIIHGRAGSRTVTSKTWTKGKNKAFVEYLSPAREKGKKMLRIDDNIWTYTPEPTDRIITISGHLLRQSVMGSDLSYEDMTENDELYEVYNAKVVEKDTLDDAVCWVVELTAKEGHDDVAYYKRKLWVDADRWLPLKGERYAKSGRLLKTTKIEEVFNVDGRWYPKKMVFKDVLSKGKGTEYIIDSIDFDVNIPEHMFTKAALRK